MDLMSFTHIDLTSVNFILLNGGSITPIFRLENWCLEA